MSMLGAAGGSDVIRAAVDRFDEKLLADPALAHYWVGIEMPRLRAHQKAFLLAALGGADLYAGRDMRGAHAGLAITDTDFDLVVAHLADSLAEVGVSAGSVAGIARLLAPLRHQIVE